MKNPGIYGDLTMKVNRRAFTLIELLVVIAIIALLVTLLVPALQEAKRQAKVVICSTDLHAIGLGLAVYVAEEDGKYPVPSISYALYVSWYDPVDNVPNLIRMAGGNTDIYYCPLDPHPTPEDNELTSTYTDYFFGWQWGGPTGQLTYSAPYSLWFLHTNGLFSWGWANSGNPDGKPPYDPFQPNTAIVTDANWAGPYDWHDPPSPAHFTGDGKHAETNVLYGDGHVETHYEMKHYVTRSSTEYCPY